MIVPEMERRAETEGKWEALWRSVVRGSPYGAWVWQQQTAERLGEKKCQEPFSVENIPSTFSASVYHSNGREQRLTDERPARVVKEILI